MEDFGIKIVDEEEEEYLRESPKLLAEPSSLPDAFSQTIEQRMRHLRILEGGDPHEDTDRTTEKATPKVHDGEHK